MIMTEGFEREFVFDEEKQYHEYIEEHIANVNLIWGHVCNLQELALDDAQFHIIDNAISVHDESKYSDVEFNGYRAYFYPIDFEKENTQYNKDHYDFSWNAHQKNNPHHWQYWILIEGENDFKILDMQYIYIVEMLCDWAAMSLKFNDTPSEFYDKNKNRIIISADTRKCVERLLPVFDETIERLRTENQG
jgi:hypothetical protein